MWFSFNDSGFQVNNWTLTNCWENFLCLRIGILAFRFPLAQQPLTPGNFLLLGKLFNRIPHLKLLNLAFLSGNKIALIHFSFFFYFEQKCLKLGKIFNSLWPTSLPLFGLFILINLIKRFFHLWGFYFNNIKNNEVHFASKRKHKMCFFHCLYYYTRIKFFFS